LLEMLRLSDAFERVPHCSSHEIKYAERVLSICVDPIS
jgi:hypothetical protein